MSDSRALLIFPFNGNAVEAMDCLGDAWTCIGFIDDHPDKIGTSYLGIEVLNREALVQCPEVKVLAVPGSPSTYLQRMEVINGLGLDDDRFARVVHPSASISHNTTIGTNCLVMAGVVLTSNAMLGNHCCVLPNTVIHHDSCVGDWTLIGAGVTVSGGTHIGRNCYVGSSSGIMNGLRIGDRSMIGFGSNVIRDVEDDSRVAGNPARPI